jgi:hypothetical protein
VAAFFVVTAADDDAVCLYVFLSLDGIVDCRPRLMESTFIDDELFVFLFAAVDVTAPIFGCFLLFYSSNVAISYFRGFPPLDVMSL